MGATERATVWNEKVCVGGPALSFTILCDGGASHLTSLSNCKVIATAAAKSL